MKIMLVAGGTGGHFFPALSMLPYLNKILHVDQFIFVLGKKKIEDHFAEMIPQDIIMYRVSGSYWAWKNPVRLAAVLLNSVQSLILIIRSRPKVIILFGSYLSLFPGIWGKLLGARVIIHEQNVIPGKVNRLLARLADEVWGTFRESKKYFPKIRGTFRHTGLPIRKNPDNPDFAGYQKETSSKRKIVFLGGSQGAAFINKLFMELIQKKNWTDSYYSILIGGLDQTTQNENNYRVLSFCDNIYNLYQEADLVVARAGASTIAEILEMKKKAILIPYPYSYQDHQLYNAREAYHLSGNNVVFFPQEEVQSGNFHGKVTEHLQKKYTWKENISFQEKVLEGLK